MRSAGMASPSGGHRWRVSFGPGNTLCFGSRRVNMVDLNALDEQCGGSQGGDDVPSRERMEDALNVHIDSKEETRAAGSSGPPPALLSSQLRRYKEACPDVEIGRAHV